MNQAEREEQYLTLILQFLQSKNGEQLLAEVKKLYDTYQVTKENPNRRYRE
jgi:hypothetical protein